MEHASSRPNRCHKQDVKTQECHEDSSGVLFSKVQDTETEIAKNNWASVPLETLWFSSVEEMMCLPAKPGFWCTPRSSILALNHLDHSGGRGRRKNKCSRKLETGGLAHCAVGPQLGSFLCFFGTLRTCACQRYY